MTEQPTRDQLRAVAARAEQADSVVYLAPRGLLALLDQLDQAETELDPWMTRAYEAEQRAWQAEARIKAVENVLDAAGDGQSTDPVTRTMYPRMINTAEIRRALGTVTTPRTE